MRLGPLVRLLASRSYLFVAAAFGATAYLATWPWIERSITRALIGWDSGVVLFLVLAFSFMSNIDAERMKRRAIAHDEGGHAILLVTILASIASVVAFSCQ